MNNSKKIFTFFSNGQTVNTIKNEAKKAHKAKKYNTHSEALNAISKSISNLSFNAAVKVAENESPFLLEDTLYFPLIFNGKTLYVTIKDNKVLVPTSEDFPDTLSFPFDHLVSVNVKDTAFKSIEKANNGWIYYLERNTETEESEHIEIYITDEGIVADFICVEEEGDNCLSPKTLLSTFAFWNEIFSEEDFEKYCS
jgi:hypothetical protein